MCTVCSILYYNNTLHENKAAGLPAECLDGRSMQNEGRGGGGIRSVVKTSLCLEIDTISSVIVNH